MNLARAAIWAVLLLAVALLGHRLGMFLYQADHALHWPFELDYGEGVVWQQANMMLTPQAYGPIDGFPAIVFNYPPLYHLATLMASAVTGADMLSAGRGVSMGCALLSAFVIAIIIARTLPEDLPAGPRALGAVIGGLSIFCFPAVTFWALTMHVDMLAFLFSLCGFWLGLKAFERPALIYAAALCFVAAVFSKQTALAAPTALFTLMLWRRRDLAFRGIATCIVFGLAILAFAGLATHGGFIRHIFAYNINPFEPERIRIVVQVAEENVPLPLVAAIGAWLRIGDIRRRSGHSGLATVMERPSDIAWIGLSFYFLTSSLMLTTVMKSGSNMNYVIEWVFVATMLAGSALGDSLLVATKDFDAKFRNAGVAAYPFVIPALFAVQPWLISLSGVDAAFNNMWDRSKGAELTALSAKMRQASKPVISDHMVLVLRSGKPVVWEPVIFSELASTGFWDERPFVGRILAGDFSMFVTNGEHGDKGFDHRYSPAVAAAIDVAYPVKEKMAGLVVHLPAP